MLRPTRACPFAATAPSGKWTLRPASSHPTPAALAPPSCAGDVSARRSAYPPPTVAQGLSGNGPAANACARTPSVSEVLPRGQRMTRTAASQTGSDYQTGTSTATASSTFETSSMSPTPWPVSRASRGGLPFWGAPVKAPAVADGISPRSRAPWTLRVTRLGCSLPVRRRCARPSRATWRRGEICSSTMFWTGAITQRYCEAFL
mmetsp:Transcript_27279/g.81387  ORF Transcript_27279/g.81387 Transcript_27279/m.81387 type:complete len:204 (-) Transcript_27279:28-639(-)